MATYRMCTTFLALSSLAVASAALAVPASPPGLTEHDVAQLASVGQAVISPDGTRVAYLKRVQRDAHTAKDGPAWSELHLTDLDGASRPFITGEVTVSALAWTPDGGGIAFKAKRDGDEHAALYVIPADGGEARRTATHATGVGAYSFSPDGHHVAFLAKEAVAEDVEKQRKQGFDAKVVEEDLRPTRVWVTALASGDDADPKVLPLEGSAVSVAWSPAGGRLAVTLIPRATVDDSLMRRKVHVVDATTGKVTGVVETEGKLGQVAWSPDGAHVAVIGAEDIHDPREGRLVVAPAGGGAVTEVLPSFEGHVRRIVWRDARTLVYVADQGVRTVVGQVRRDGRGHKAILNPAPGAWQISLSRDGKRVALVGSTPEHPSELFAGRLGKALKRITNSNPWLAERTLAPLEVVTHTARDGLRLEGLLIKPLNHTEGQRVPLILSVHGGPESNVRHGWLTSYGMLGQVAAARGFAVFYPNYRGSTGRGVAFSKAGQGDPAGKEFDDLVDAVDHLVASGLVDKERVGVIGGSYGGYAAAWCSTYYSARFAAAVMFVGISNKISKTGTTDIADEEFLVHARKRPWDDWQMYLERSPIYHVQKSHTPLLIAHGAKDPRVHPGQSLELYRFLKVLGKTVRLVMYPGEGHGNRRAASRLDYNLRAMRWFQHYLQGPGGDPPPAEVAYQPAAAD